MKQIALHDVKIEKEGDNDEGDQRSDGYNLHGEIALRALHIAFCRLFTTHFLGSEPYGTFDNAPRLDDAQYSCHGNATDTDALGIVREDSLRRHLSYSLRNLRVPLIEYAIAPD